MYIYVTARKCPVNAYYFISLGEYVILDGDHEISLVECQYSHQNLRTYICCDLVESSFIHDSKWNILRAIKPQQQSIFFSHYIKLKELKFNTIKLWIMDDNGTLIDYKRNFGCTLHIRKIK